MSTAQRWSPSPALRGTLTLLAVLLLGIVWHGQGAFHRPNLHLVLWDSVSVGGIVAIGECFVILGGGIDLSVGAVLALCGTAFAGLMVEADWPWPPALLAAVLLGAGVGASSGALVARFRLQPFLVTLAAMVIARGLARFLPQLAGKPAGAKFMPQSSSGPAFWQWLGGRTHLELPTLGLLFALIVLFGWLLVWLLVRLWARVRHLLAAHGDEEATRPSGSMMRPFQVLAYTAGSLAAFVTLFVCVLSLFGRDLPQRTVLEIPTQGLLFALTALLGWLLVRRTVYGRHLLAVGGSEEAARLSGVRTTSTKVLAYAACGGLAGLGGVCTVARDLHGNPGAGELYELQAIAAVVVGGTSLQGGRGGIGLAVLGVFTIGYIDKVLSINSVESHWRLVIQGCIILLAVLFQDRRR